MKTYTVTVWLEIMSEYKVRADSVDDAKQIASQRAFKTCKSIVKSRAKLHDGAVTDTYIFAEPKD